MRKVVVMRLFVSLIIFCVFGTLGCNSETLSDSSSKASEIGSQTGNINGTDKPSETKTTQDSKDSDAVVDPADPAVDPADPVVDPADPVVDPADPAVDPADPVVDPADPVVDPEPKNIVAISQSQNILKDKSIQITLNSSETDGVIFSIIDQPQNGKITGSPPTLTYTPEESFVGTDSFSFRAQKAGFVSANIANVLIEVEHPIRLHFIDAETEESEAIDWTSPNFKLDLGNFMDRDLYTLFMYGTSTPHPLKLKDGFFELSLHPGLKAQSYSSLRANPTCEIQDPDFTISGHDEWDKHWDLNPDQKLKISQLTIKNFSAEGEVAAQTLEFICEYEFTIQTENTYLRELVKIPYKLNIVKTDLEDNHLVRVNLLNVKSASGANTSSPSQLDQIVSVLNSSLVYNEEQLIEFTAGSFIDIEGGEYYNTTTHGFAVMSQDHAPSGALNIFSYNTITGALGAARKGQVVTQCTAPACSYR